MPSPIAHAAMGYAIYHIARHRFPQHFPERGGLLIPIATTGLALLPDLDSVVGVLLGDFGAYHNQLSHSLVFGLGAATGVALLVRTLGRRDSGFWFALALLNYSVHVMMDSLQGGRGTLMLWPFSSERVVLPLQLFHGLNWSEILTAWDDHFWTITTESLFAIVILVLAWRITSRKNVA